jgi:hypothetical protein
VKNWKAILAFVAVFILGTIAGGAFTEAAAAKRLLRVLHGRPALTAEQVTRRLTRQLRLDPGQTEQMLTLVQAAQAQITDARQQCVPRVLAALDDFDAKARVILRPNQAEQFDKLVAERKARWANYKGD